MQTPLTSVLHQADLLNLMQQQEVSSFAHAEGISIPSALVDLNILTSDDLARQLESIFSIALTDIHQYDYQAVAKIYASAKQSCAIALSRLN